MRGKAATAVVAPVTAGITPAYAGKSVNLFCIHTCEQDHPCVCGEKRQRLLCILLNRGSPLRMRGKEVFTKIFAIGLRITPAYAGKRMYDDGSKAND